MEIGERLYNLKRAYNVLTGVSAATDTVPQRIVEILRPGRPAAEGEELFLKMRREYYLSRGWDEKGIPTAEKLVSLGLGEAAEKIR
jgi:aldehyde:ferredoxin oxidoreductase